MRIGILGPLEVAEDGRPVEVGGARLRALLTLLALEAGRTVPVERLIDDMWEDRPPAGAPNALQSLISRLRTLVGREVIESRTGGYRLTLPREAVDAHDFEARVLAARRAADPADRGARLRAALELWRGPALADVARMPFAGAPTARLEGLRRSAIEDRIEADLALGRYAELIPELQALAAADPLREPLRARLMRALYGAGRQAEALTVYEDTKHLLSETLGVDPSPELANVHLAVLRQDPTLLNGREAGAPQTPVREDAPEPSRRGETPPHNLRARITSFIGRDDDVKRVAKMLAESRLVTLTGPGGAGKTRLSQEAGERMLDQLPDGVWFIELAPVSDPAEVPHAVLSALALRETALIAARGRITMDTAAEPLDRLAGALAEKELLLLLDNCEHLLDAAALLADRLLADCPGVRVLATSREPLGITGESLWPVEPLALPPEETPPEEAVGYPAVRLFADRAGAVRPGFAVADRNVGQIVQICRALDGMPLAIELAAARLRALTPEQLAARLDDRFRLLTAGSRTALPRHQTLRAVVEWSWDLLDDAERALWRRMSVFTGGATSESAEAICAGPELAAADVFGVLTALVDKSLVILRTDGAAEPRYLMLETIRAYGQERLAEAGEQERIRAAHAAHFIAFAELAEPELRARHQVEWMVRLTADHDNIHAALRWAISTRNAALAVRACAALGWYWWLRGHWSEGNDAASEVLRMPGLPQDQTTAVAAAISAMSSFGGPRDSEEVKDWLRLAKDLARSLGERTRHPVLRLMLPIAEVATIGMDWRSLDRVEPLFADEDPWVAAMARFIHGQIAMNIGRVDLPDADFAAALAGFRSVGDRWGISFALSAQAELHTWRGEHHEAIALYREALRLIDELGMVEESVWHIDARLANELALLGERQQAEKLLEGALRRVERYGTPEMLAAIHYQYGEFARRDGDNEEAARRLARAQTLSTQAPTGPPQFSAMIASSLGMLACADGRLDEARAHHRHSLERALSAWDNPVIAQSLTGYADLAVRESEPERAAELLGMADAVRGMRDLSMPDAGRIETVLLERLGDEVFAAAYGRGRALDLEGVLDRFEMKMPPPPTL